VCTHDAGTVLRHRLVLDQQRLGHALDGDGKARRRPVAGGALHHRNQHLGVGGG
jgi:hypothetical protein